MLSPAGNDQRLGDHHAKRWWMLLKSSTSALSTMNVELQNCKLLITLSYRLIDLKYITWQSYMAASKRSRKYFISDKYKTLQPFKLHLLQNSLPVQLHTSASDCKCCKHSWMPFCKSLFSSSVAFSMSVSSQQRRPFNADFSHRNS